MLKEHHYKGKFFWPAGYRAAVTVWFATASEIALWTRDSVFKLGEPPRLAASA